MHADLDVRHCEVLGATISEARREIPRRRRDLTRFIRSILLKKLSTVQLRLYETEHCNRNQGTNLRIVIGTTIIR
jgi:hypothetical protein